MAFLDQILHLPYAYFWLPAAVFFTVAGALYWVSRPTAVGAAVEATVTPLTAEGLTATLPAVTATKAKDQRGMARRAGNTVEVHVAKPEDKRDPATGSVLDRSMGGMRLALFHPVESGVILSIRPVHADNMVPWIDLEVRSCKPSKEMPGQFEVGCQYVKSPPYSIQLLFG